MRKIFIVGLLLIVGLNLKAQEYMAIIMEQSCNCVGEVPDSLSGNAFNMQLGLCMLEAAMPYKEEIKRDFNINLDNIDVEGEAFGKIIGIKMVGYCPEVMLKLTQKVEMQKEEEEKPEFVTGKITNVGNDGFVVLSIKDETGKERKYYWLSFVESEFDMVNSYEELKGKKVKVSYFDQELFDSRLKEYRQFLILESLEVL